MDKLTPAQVDFIKTNHDKYSVREFMNLLSVRKTLVFSCLKTHKLKAKRSEFVNGWHENEVVIDFNSCPITGYKYF